MKVKGQGLGSVGARGGGRVAKNGGEAAIASST